MSLIKKNILFNTLLSLSQILFPLITFPYASRILGPAVVGKVNFIDSLTQYFALLSAIGIPLYAVRELSKIKDDFKQSNKLFSELLVLHAITTAFFALIYWITLVLINKESSYAHLGYIGIGILISNVFIIEWYFQAQQKFEYITKRSLIIKIVFVFLMFKMVKTQSDVYLYYLLFFIVNAVNAISNFYLAIKSGVSLTFKSLDLKKHIKPLLLLTACSVIGSIYVLLDNVILGLLSTSQSVGYYSTGVKITKVPISLINALGVVLIPSISSSFSNNNFEAIKYYIDNSIQYVLTIGIPMSFGIALTAKWTVLIVAGAQFAPSINLVIVLSPIIILIALNCIYFFQLFTPGGRESTMVIILALSSFISIILNVILIRYIQHLGAAITTTITELAVFLLSVFYSKKLYDFDLNLKYFVNPILSSILFIPVIFFIDKMAIIIWLKFILGISACAFIYYLMQRLVFKDNMILRMENYAVSMISRQK